MRKTIITFITAFALVLASAFVFSDATDRNITLSARELDYMTAGPNEYDFSYLTKENIEANWEDIKSSWADLKAQIQDSSIAEFFDTFDFGETFGSWNTEDFTDNIKDFFGDFNYRDMMHTNS